jgi:hypothetical protein
MDIFSIFLAGLRLNKIKLLVIMHVYIIIPNIYKNVKKILQVDITE